MRQDMYKVIVERPRRGGGYRSELPAPDDLEDSPRQEGLRKRHRSRKWLNENLRPLERFLASQVGRPWDKVYSELCAGIDRRNTVQQHIHQHLEDFVAIRVVEINGELCNARGWRALEPIKNRWGPRFYVDPHTGLLVFNEARLRERQAWMTEYRETLRARRDDARDDRLILDESAQLHRIKGVWYRIELAAITERAILDREIDAIRKLQLDRCPRRYPLKGIASHLDIFGNPDVYARSKRQLNARELKHYRLRNDNA